MQHALNVTVFRLSCFARWFFLGKSDVPFKQAEVAKGNSIVPPWNRRKIPLGVYWTSLLAVTSRAGPLLWSWDPVPTVPSMLGLSCQSLLLARSKDSKSCTSTYTHPSPSIAWDTGILLRAAMYIYTHVCVCARACYPRRCTKAFLSVWLLQGQCQQGLPPNSSALRWRRGRISPRIILQLSTRDQER